LDKENIFGARSADKLGKKENQDNVEEDDGFRSSNVGSKAPDARVALEDFE